jgi:hypothetical protein
VEVCGGGNFSDNEERVVYQGCMVSANFPFTPISTTGDYHATLYLNGGRPINMLTKSEADGAVEYMIYHGVPSRCMTCPVGPGDLSAQATADRALNPRDDAPVHTGQQGPGSGSDAHGAGN